MLPKGGEKTQFIGHEQNMKSAKFTKKWGLRITLAKECYRRHEIRSPSSNIERIHKFLRSIQFNKSHE